MKTPSERAAEALFPHTTTQAEWNSDPLVRKAWEKYWKEKAAIIDRETRAEEMGALLRDHFTALQDYIGYVPHWAEPLETFLARLNPAPTSK